MEKLGWQFKTTVEAIEDCSAYPELSLFNEMCMAQFKKTWKEKLQEDPSWIKFKEAAAVPDMEVWLWDDCFCLAGVRAFAVRDKDAKIIASYGIARS
jgi:hypothetical protein